MIQSDPKDEAQKVLAATVKEGGLHPGARFRHYKGGVYEVVCVSVDEDTLEPLVTYRSLTKGTLWTRTLRNWSEVWMDGDMRIRRFSPLRNDANETVLENAVYRVAKEGPY